MIINSHAHVVLPADSYKYIAELIASRAYPHFPPVLTYEAVHKAGQMIVDIMHKVGPERVLFATDNPGTGSAIDPKIGRGYDDSKPVIEGIEFRSDKELENIFECNCARAYTHFKNYK